MFQRLRVYRTLHKVGYSKIKYSNRVIHLFFVFLSYLRFFFSSYSCFYSEDMSMLYFSLHLFVSRVFSLLFGLLFCVVGIILRYSKRLLFSRVIYTYRIFRKLCFRIFSFFKNRSRTLIYLNKNFSGEFVENTQYFYLTTVNANIIYGNKELDGFYIFDYLFLLSFDSILSYCGRFSMLFFLCNVFTVSCYAFTRFLRFYYFNYVLKINKFFDNKDRLFSYKLLRNYSKAMCLNFISYYSLYLFILFYYFLLLDNICNFDEDLCVFYKYLQVQGMFSYLSQLFLFYLNKYIVLNNTNFQDLFSLGVSLLSLLNLDVVFNIRSPIYV